MAERFATRLSREIHWVREDLLSPGQAERILAPYAARPPLFSRPIVLLSLIGVALIAAGIALVVAHNWDETHRWAKVGGLVTLLGAAQLSGLSLRERDYSRVGEGLLVIGTGLPLAGIAFAGLSSVVSAATIEESLRYVTASRDYIEITESAGIAIDLRYATPNNFLGQNLYGVFNRVFLHRIAAEKLTRAVENLTSANPKYKLVIFDALRPRSIQHLLWNKVKGTSQEKYVANPKWGSSHNFGLALDVSILDEHGTELDMGTPYDDFTPLAEPRLEEKFLRQGKLTIAQINNRRLLRKVMGDAGFVGLAVEWWHFDALPPAQVRKQYPIVE